MAARCYLATLLFAALLTRTCAVAPAIPFFCRLNELQCPSKINQCIHSLELCNGIKNCADGSDENRTLCKAYGCNDIHPLSPVDLAPMFDSEKKRNRKCPSGNMCTKTSAPFMSEEAWLCSGVRDCVDGSDEDPRYCKTLAQNCSFNSQGVFDISLGAVADTCPSKKHCVGKFKLCDRKKDCVDGSDEWPSFCETYGCPHARNGSFRCKDWGCLDNEDQLCDGVKDCGDGSDEDPAFCANYSCPNTKGNKCPDGRTCLDPSQICDGFKACPDGSDESPSFCRTFKCPGKKYKCKDGMQCAGYLEFDARCSGIAPGGERPYCVDKSDANNALCPSLLPIGGATTYNCSDTGKFVGCPGGVGCLFKTTLCDGIKDCKDGSDEGKFCETYDCRYLISDSINVPFVHCKDTFECRPGSACNGWIDCKDKSDEDPAFCLTYKCPSGYQKCKNFPYQCVSEEQLCDGRKQCINGGDEDPAFCKALKCPAGQQKCPTDPYRCIDEHLLCDGTKNCVNGGDEDPAFCKAFKCFGDKKKCPNYPYQCVYSSSLCNGFKECPNGGDEDPVFCQKFNCSEGLTKCPKSLTYQCTYEETLCDGSHHCKDDSDENPDFCKTYKCLVGYQKCPSSTVHQCILEYALCDGIDDCRDGSDENSTFCKSYNCTAGMQKCPNSPTNKCISVRSVCDGFSDCVDGSDESPAFCRTYKCPANTWKCPNLPVCIPDYAVCDGQWNCVNRADEDPTLCSNFTQISPHVKGSVPYEK